MAVKPLLGDIVTYRSRNGDGVMSPAVVLRTKGTTILEVVERWSQELTDPITGKATTLSGVGRPEAFVAELPDDFTVDLLVFGLGGNYREYAVPYSRDAGARTWTDRRY